MQNNQVSLLNHLETRGPLVLPHPLPFSQVPLWYLSKGPIVSQDEGGKGENRHIERIN